MDGLAAPASFEFTAANALGSVREGDALLEGGPVTLHVNSNAPDGFITTVWRDGEVLRSDRQNDITLESDAGPAVYRVEIHSSDATHGLAWLYSNPIYVRATLEPERTRASRPVPVRSGPLFDGGADRWRQAADATSQGSVDVARSGAVQELHFRFK